VLIRRLRLDHPGQPASPCQPRLPPDRSPRFPPPTRRRAIKQTYQSLLGYVRCDV